MTMYQRIPTHSTRIDPVVLVATAGIVLLSVVATAAIVRWLPDPSRDGEPSVTPPVPATAAQASSASPATPSALPAARTVRAQESGARLASA